MNEQIFICKNHATHATVQTHSLEFESLGSQASEHPLSWPSRNSGLPDSELPFPPMSWDESRNFTLCWRLVPWAPWLCWPTFNFQVFTSGIGIRFDLVQCQETNVPFRVHLKAHFLLPHLQKPNRTQRSMFQCLWGSLLMSCQFIQYLFSCN